MTGILGETKLNPVMKPIVERSAAIHRPNPIPGMGSVRHVQPYGGSTNPEDLLNLYVGNTHYRKINRYLRSPDHQTGINEILDEFVRDGRKPIPYQEAYNDHYEALNRQYKVLSGDVDANNLLSFSSRSKEQSLQALSQQDREFKRAVHNSSILGDIIDYLKYQGKQAYYDEPKYRQAIQELLDITPEKLAAIPAQKEVEIVATARQKATELSSWSPLRQEAEQVVASIPYIQQAVVQQPTIAAVDYKKGASDWINWLDENFHPGYTTAESNAFQQYLTKNNIEDLLKANEIAEQVSAGNRIIPSSVPSLSRGLHFKSPEEYAAFKSLHAVGNVVEYPAFTSTTTSNSIADGFSADRGWEHPVVMNIEPSPQGYNAFDVNNPAEAEYLYSPNSRFEVVSSKVIPGTTKTGYDFLTSQPEQYQMPEGLELTVKETTQPTATQARTQSILDNFKAKRAQQLLNAHLAAVEV